METTQEVGPVAISATRQKYEVVNGSWPVPRDQLPPLTAAMAKRAFRVLYRHRFHHKWTQRVVAVKGSNRRTWPDWIIVDKKRRRQVHGMIVAPDAGWHSFIHDLSHWMHRRQYPKQNPHRGSNHAAVERDLIEQVIKRGWLEVKLKAEIAQAKPKIDVQALRAKRVQDSLKRWETKRKRAETAIRKLKRKAARYAKIIGL